MYMFPKSHNENLFQKNIWTIFNYYNDLSTTTDQSFYTIDALMKNFGLLKIVFVFFCPDLERQIQIE